ncbi:Crp/Fnr family transcriptional regulator [Veillonella criceti]|uniref:Transcriptional regulator FixK n=1 Tax=Veillonella criceti TaxID=103891 RepID=A0A380NPC3_9FIRM|nr:Crp/Fnr family transcriptional regulator [Veillonella criceti]SUP44438.1 transcriptional regulator FixK [Veillonella criceti]
MLLPRYIFMNDFIELHSILKTAPFVKQQLGVGDFLWKPDEQLQYIHYIESGLAKTYIVHETGRRKIISYHGVGTIFPVFHELDFKIEQALVTEAVRPMTVLSFTRADFKVLVDTVGALYPHMVSWYARYINLLLYETAHQEYNAGFVKVCNILFLLQTTADAEGLKSLSISQEELAEILGMSRVNLTRHIRRLRDEGIINTSRKCIEILKLAALLAYCSGETKQETK